MTSTTEGESSSNEDGVEALRTIAEGDYTP